MVRVQYVMVSTFEKANGKCAQSVQTFAVFFYVFMLITASVFLFCSCLRVPSLYRTSYFPGRQMLCLEYFGVHMARAHWKVKYLYKDVRI